MTLRAHIRDLGRRPRRVACIALLALPALLLAIRLYPHRPLRDQVPQSTAIWSADGELLRATLAADDQYRLWTPLSEMSPALVRAFRFKEDRWFYWHPGVNPFALIRAARSNWRGQGRQALRRSPCNWRGCCIT